MSQSSQEVIKVRCNYNIQFRSSIKNAKGSRQISKRKKNPRPIQSKLLTLPLQMTSRMPWMALQQLAQWVFLALTRLRQPRLLKVQENRIVKTGQNLIKEGKILLKPNLRLTSRMPSPLSSCLILWLISLEMTTSPHHQKSPSSLHPSKSRRNWQKLSKLKNQVQLRRLL